MSGHFQITALDSGNFANLWQLSDQALQQRSMRRITVDDDSGYPCRVSLMDARLGEQVLAVPYEFHAVDSFYRASGPIYVRQHAETEMPATDEIPAFLKPRLLSVRGYDNAAMMRRADAIAGDQLHGLLDQWFAEPAIVYAQIHNARTGCFLCQANRAA